MKSSEYRKFNKTSVKSAVRLSVIIVFTLFATQCNLFQSQQDQTYRLTNKTFEGEKSLTFSEKDEELFSLIMLDTDGETDQLWQITPEGEDYHRIENKSLEDRSLEVFDGEKDNRTRMTESAEDEGQLWEIIPVEKDFYRISNKWLGANKSLMTKKDEYYKMSLEASSETDGQLWKRISVGNDYFRFVNKLYGDQITLYPYASGKLEMEPVKDIAVYTYQHWKMESVGNNYYRIINRLDVYDKLNKSMDFISDDKNNFAVKMNAASDADGQKWRMESVGNDYFRLTNANGKSLQAKFISEYHLIMADSDHNDPNQLWKIIRLQN